MGWLTAKGFEIKNGKVFFNSYNRDLATIANENPTPIYLTNGNRIEQNVLTIQRTFKEIYGGDFQINYAIKANYAPQILKIVANLGLGADVVSPNEALLALKAGIPKEKVIFTGTSVSDEDISFLLKNGIKINIDSQSQLRRLFSLSQRERLTVKPLSVRLNPNMGAGLNPDVITAGVQNEDGIYIKFGIPENKINEPFVFASRNGLTIDTLHFHIGSGWLGNSLNDFKTAFFNTLNVYMQLLKTHGKSLKQLDIGGGPGIPYRPEQESFPWQQYAEIVRDGLIEYGVKLEKLILEPGRSIVGDSTVLLTKVNTVEEKNGILHAFVDASMGSLIRPKLYHAYHHIINVSNPNTKTFDYSVDGNVCETGDTFTQNHLRSITEIREGDILAILDAGAYGDSMSSQYCMRGRPNVLLIHKGKVIQCSKNGPERLEDILSRFNLF